MERSNTGQVETVGESDVKQLLEQVLAPLGSAQPAPAAHVRSFLKYVSTCGLASAGYRLRREPKTPAALYILFLPGNTAIAMPTDPGPGAADLADLQTLLRVVLDELSSRNLCYVQALVEPEATGKRELLLKCGFRRLTRLIYLHLDNVAPPPGPPARSNLAWMEYGADRHEAFARIIEATYEGSLDCPELTSMRSIDDVIASHKAAGEFDASLWEIARIGHEHVGCVLLSRLVGAAAAEIVYLGVTPRWRGRGVGALLLRRAIEQIARIRMREISVAVDERNAPARQLYARFGFTHAGERDAYIRSDKTIARLGVIS